MLFWTFSPEVKNEIIKANVFLLPSRLDIWRMVLVLSIHSIHKDHGREGERERGREREWGGIKQNHRQKHLEPTRPHPRSPAPHKSTSALKTYL